MTTRGFRRHTAQEEASLIDAKAAEVRRLGEELDRYKKALLCYGRHLPGCELSAFRPESKCTCGFLALVI